MSGLGVFPILLIVSLLALLLAAGGSFFLTNLTKSDSTYGQHVRVALFGLFVFVVVCVLSFVFKTPGGLLGAAVFTALVFAFVIGPFVTRRVLSNQTVSFPMGIAVSITQTLILAAGLTAAFISTAYVAQNTDSNKQEEFWE